jgi:phosphopantetheinyl transferase
LAEGRAGEVRLGVQVARVDEADGDTYWMSASERQRCAALARARRPAFVASRRLLRRALAQATGLAEAGWQVTAEAGVAPRAGRPELASGLAPQVSIAHRLGWVAVAVGPAEGGPIGVDLECDRPGHGDPAGRAALAMPADELATWLTLERIRREPALLGAWVAREAWFKAAGGGAPWDFRRLACAPCEAALANVRIWEAGDVHVALCARDAGALSAATCDGWADGADVRASSWRVAPTAPVDR